MLVEEDGLNKKPEFKTVTWLAGNNDYTNRKGGSIPSPIAPSHQKTKNAAYVY